MYTFPLIHLDEAYGALTAKSPKPSPLKSPIPLTEVPNFEFVVEFVVNPEIGWLSETSRVFAVMQLKRVRTIRKTTCIMPKFFFMESFVAMVFPSVLLILLKRVEILILQKKKIR